MKNMKMSSVCEKYHWLNKEYQWKMQSHAEKKYTVMTKNKTIWKIYVKVNNQYFCIKIYVKNLPYYAKEYFVSLCVCSFWGFEKIKQYDLVQN